MNKVMLIGRLTSKPELKYTSSNMTYTRFSIAINRMPDKNGNIVADFPNIVAWNKQAENLCKYQDKGAQVAVEGRIQTGSYEKDGIKIHTTDVQADRIEFLDSKNTKEDEETDPYAEFGESVEIDDNFLE